MLDQVEVFCPHCFANYFVSPERIPEEGVTTPCKKCSKTFTMIKASGDPVRDRANRQQGFVVVHAKKRRAPEQETDGDSIQRNALGRSQQHRNYSRKKASNLASVQQERSSLW